MNTKEYAVNLLLKMMRDKYPEEQHVALSDFGLVEGHEKAVQWQAAGCPSIWDAVANAGDIVIMYDYARAGIALFDLKNVGGEPDEVSAEIVRASDMIIYGDTIAVNLNATPNGTAWLYGAIEDVSFTQHDEAEGILTSEAFKLEPSQDPADAVAKAPVTTDAVVQPEVKAEAPAPEEKPEATTEAAPATKAKSAKA